MDRKWPEDSTDDVDEKSANESTDSEEDLADEINSKTVSDSLEQAV